MLRTLLIMLALLVSGCGPKASPAEPVAVSSAVTPYEVELAAGTDPLRLDELARVGAELVRNPHLEGDIYLVRMDRVVAQKVSALDFVRRADALPAERRYEASRFEGLTEPVAVVIDVFAGADRAKVLDTLQVWGASPTTPTELTIRATVAKAKLGELAMMHGVRWIEPR